MRNICDECDAGYKGMCTMDERPCKAKEWYDCGRADMQEFVEKSCKELGIDYTLIFTCDVGKD